MIEPDEILALAETLLTDVGGSESAFRSAASRAYYSIFHFLGKELGEADYHEGVNVHGRLQAALFEEKDTGVLEDHIITARNYFTSLRDKRVTSDYRLDAKFEKWHAELAVTQAREIFHSKPSSA